MRVQESAHVFQCGEAQLVGIAHRPARMRSLGVVVVVGGQQYRAGAHRQLVLLARTLAEQGFPVFRFDYRGMGDSGGSPRSFDSIKDDIHAAMDCFQEQCPNLNKIVLWGLCDGATAAAWYAHEDRRVAGLVLVNPWMRSEQGAAKAQLTHYYPRRLMSWEFWTKLARGGVNPLRAACALLHSARTALTSKMWAGKQAQCGITERTASALDRFPRAVLTILSGNDLTAAEFADAVRGSRRWQSLFRQKRFVRWELGEADHTFSRHAWREKLAARTVEWMRAIEG